MLALSACGRPKLSGTVGPTVNTAMLAKSEETRKARRVMTDSEAMSFVGDDKCVQCHEPICKMHSKTHHVDTFRAVSVKREGPMFRTKQILTDPVRNINYSAIVDGSECYLVGYDERYRKNMRADYVIGSAPHGYTFFSDQGASSWLEMRTSYYPHLKSWYFTPNQLPNDRDLAPAGIVFPADTMAACIHCHVTALRGDDTHLDLKKSRLGIGCERCHGPGKDHLEAVRASKSQRGIVEFKMEKLGEAPAEKVEKLCAECHKTSSGMPNDPHIEESLARIPAAALERSACYQQSHALSCINCHNPHTNVSNQISQYNNACLQCHSAPSTAKASSGTPRLPGTRDMTKPIVGDFKHIICKVNPRTGCVNCHMPKQPIPILSIQSTNHWIKVWKRASS